MRETTDKSAEEIWQEEWKEICTDEQGNIDLEQIKKELSDFSMMLEEVPKVYCHITDSTLSKPNYKAQAVIDVFEDRKREDIIQTLKEAFEDDIIDKNTLEELKRYF